MDGAYSLWPPGRWNSPGAASGESLSRYMLCWAGQFAAPHKLHVSTSHRSCMLPGSSFSESPITCTMLRRDWIQPSHGPDCTLSHWQEINDRPMTQSIATPPFLIWVLPSLKKVWNRRSDPARTLLSYAKLWPLHWSCLRRSRPAPMQINLSRCGLSPTYHGCPLTEQDWPNRGPYFNHIRSPCILVCPAARAPAD